MKALLKRMARSAGIRLTGMASAGGGVQPDTHVGEITPMDARTSDFRGRRLNLLVPSINARHYFGGIHTAMLVFEQMARHFESCRIVLTDSVPDAEALARFSSYTLAQSDDDSAASRQVVAFADRYGKSLPVGKDDHWLATAWWTAYAAQGLAAWQKQAFGHEGRIAYMIQDFEPGFYAWSSRSALALATYRPDRDLAIFNTSLLADFFKSEGLSYSRHIVFEPTINDGLREPLARARESEAPRKKRIVVYARPSTPRNAFELICEALRAWAWSDPDASSWEVVAPGELSEDIDLGPLRLRGIGKMTIADYAELLSTSAIGLSLMISPHPSYPPLEMAAFGMGVLTNSFANKDLSLSHSGVRPLSGMAPRDIAEALTRETADWHARGMRALPILDANHPFLGAGGFDELGQRAATEMGA